MRQKSALRTVRSRTDTVRVRTSDEWVRRSDKPVRDTDLFVRAADETSVQLPSASRFEALQQTAASRAKRSVERDVLVRGREPRRISRHRGTAERRECDGIAIERDT